MVPPSLQAAKSLAQNGIEAEVLDLRTLAPWDRRAVVSSVRRTHRLVVAHEAWVAGGFGAEVAAAVAEETPESLVAPVARVGARPVPIPSGPLRRHALPSAGQIAEAVRSVIGEGDS
jgi:pyruvate/2-oxoglutarate/acetoin dehydrogenase E1 component